MIIGVDSVRVPRLAVVPPVILLLMASTSFLDSHIYRWRGVITVLVIGLATGWLALVRSADRPRSAEE